MTEKREGAQGRIIDAFNKLMLARKSGRPRVAEIVAEAGFPAGAYNVVTGFGAEIGDDLTSSNDVDFVTFTGSSVVGQHINEICARNNPAKARAVSSRCA